MPTLALLVACDGGVLVDDTDGVDTSDTSGDTDDSGDPPADVDQDGYTTADDCDDYDPAIHPGATEVWNEEDDDCDGFADGDGTYSGNHRVVADTIYEGNAYRWTFDCPATLTRSGSYIDFLATCTTDPTDSLQRQALGESFWIEEDQNVMGGATWSGTTVVTSQAGWDTDGTGSLAWSGFASTSLVTAVRAAYLDLDGSGTLSR